MRAKALAILVSTLSLTSLLVPAALTAQKETPPGWERVDVVDDGRVAFTIALPPGWIYEPREGFDSLIGAFVGQGTELTFDYGWYSSSLPEIDELGYVGELTRISCKEAKLVAAAAAPADITGVYFPQIFGEKIFDGEETREFVTELQIHGRDLDPTQRALALRIFETVHFPEHCLQGEWGEWEILQAPEDVTPMAVAFHGPDAGWAVGVAFSPLRCALARFRDGAWEPVACPVENVLTAVSLTGPDEGWAVGAKTILRLEAGTWSVYSDSVKATLFDVDMLDPTEGWAIGVEGLLRFDEGAWRPVVTEPQVRGLAIDVHAPDAIYAGGTSEFFRFDGDVWHKELDPAFGLPGSFGFFDLEVLDAQRVWYAGVDLGTEEVDGIVVRRLAPGGHDLMPLPGTGRLWSLEVFATDGPVNIVDNRAWAVGGNVDGEPASVVELHDGQWHSLRTPFGGYLRSLDMLSTNEGWAAGWQESIGTEGEPEVTGVLMHYRSYPGRAPLVTAPPPTTTPAVTPVPPPVLGVAYIPIAVHRLGTGADGPTR